MPPDIQSTDSKTPIDSSTNSDSNRSIGKLITITQVSLPKIMEWYSHDFGKSKVDIINWILRYYFLSSERGRIVYSIKEDVNVVFEKFSWEFNLYFAIDNVPFPSANSSANFQSKYTPEMSASKAETTKLLTQSSLVLQCRKSWDLSEEITSISLTMNAESFPVLVIGHLAQLWTLIDHLGDTRTLKVNVGERENDHPSFYSQDLVCYKICSSSSLSGIRMVTCSGGSLSHFIVTQSAQGTDMEQQWEICVPEELFAIRESSISSFTISDDPQSNTQQILTIILACSWDGMLYIIYSDQSNKPKVVKYAFEDRVRAFTVGSIGVPSSNVPIEYDLNKPKESRFDEKRNLGNRNSNCLIFVSHSGEINVLLDFQFKLPDFSTSKSLTNYMEDDLSKFQVISEFFSQEPFSSSKERVGLEKRKLFRSCLYTEFDAQAIQAYKASLLATLSKASKDNQRYSNDKPP